MMKNYYIDGSDGRERQELCGLRRCINKNGYPANGFAGRAKALLTLSLCFVGYVWALEPPRPGEIEELKRKGQLEARLGHARSLGNYELDPYLMQRAIAKMRQSQLESQGMSKTEAEAASPLPAPPPGWQGGLPTSGTPKVLAILISFQDYPSTVSSTTISNMLFAGGDPADYPRESLTNYYERASYGQLHITGDVLGWYQTAYNRSTIDTNNAPTSRDDLIKEVLNYYDSLGYDFSQYDNDGDGDIEYFIVMWTGPDTGWSSFWWGYQTSFSDGGYTIDGKTLGKYSWQWESDRPTVVIHETGHALGLPDYYDYDDTVGPDGGLGGLDMMDGNWGDHNCFSKWLLEWLTPTLVSSGSQVMSLRASGWTNDAVAIFPGVSSIFDEFYMVQNRYRIQNDDNYPADGMLIWHIDATLDGGGNNYMYNNSYTSHKLIRLMEADGLEEIENNLGGADSGDYYVPGRKLTPYSSPSSLKYDGSDSCVRVAGFSAPGLVMSAGFSVECYVPEITIASDVYFTDTCSGTTNPASLYVCNTGNSNLIVGPISSSNPNFRVVPPSSSYPVVISPDFCFPFRVEFSPTSGGSQETTFIVPSNDPISPTNLVSGFGVGVWPSISTFVADSGDFGDVCVGNYRDLSLTINNPGGCTLIISNISSFSSQFLEPEVMNYPVTVHPGDSVEVPIRFQPTSLGAKNGIISINSNIPQSPNWPVSVAGNAPSGDVRVTGSTDFGEVCFGGVNEKTISVCNVGKCDLTVFSASLASNCLDFVLLNNPFPAVVSHDSCVDLVIRFTPSSCGEKNCNLQILTDDPDTPVINLTVTASTPCASIDVPPDLAFPPTVISSMGPCQSLKPFPISNTGNCPLAITDISISGPEAVDYSLVGLPSFPIILEPGHVVGEGDLRVAFSPAAIDRDREATITVTYVTDPVAGTTTSVSRKLCGEGVHTGARVLVMVGGIPIANVEKVQLQRINGNRNKKPLDTNDVMQDAPLTTVVPDAPCPPFQYHREYGTVSNPIQLLAGSYQVTVSAIVNGKRKHQTVGFDVSTCDFNPTIVINY